MGVTKSGHKGPRVAGVRADFELKPQYLYESIAGILDGDGNPHFAPLGVRVTSIGDAGRVELEARVFTTSKLYSCLKRGGECTVHFPGASQLEFFFLPFRDALPGLHEKVAKPENVIAGRTVKTPVLKDVPNYMEAGVTWVKDEDVNDAISATRGKKATRGVFLLASRVIIIGDPGIKPVSRHDGLILELLVQASRFRFLPPGSKEQQASLSNMFEVLDKLETIAPGDEKNELARELLASLKHTPGARQ